MEADALEDETFEIADEISDRSFSFEPVNHFDNDMELSDNFAVHVDDLEYEPSEPHVPEVRERDAPNIPDFQVVTGTAWDSMLAHAFASNLSVAESLPLPWETGTMMNVFSNNHKLKAVPSVCDDTDLSLIRESKHADSVATSTAVSSLGPQPAFLSAVKSIKDVDYMDNKRVQISLACSKWMELLSIEWKASQTGEQIMQDLSKDPTGELAEQSLKAVFGVKSPSTLLKRAASVRQFVTWFQRYCIENDRYTSPFPFFEEDVWQYFLHLRSVTHSTKRGYTVSSTFLENNPFLQVRHWFPWM